MAEPERKGKQTVTGIYELFHLLSHTYGSPLLRLNKVYNNELSLHPCKAKALILDPHESGCVEHAAPTTSCSNLSFAGGSQSGMRKRRKRSPNSLFKTVDEMWGCSQTYSGHINVNAQL